MIITKLKQYVLHKAAFTIYPPFIKLKKTLKNQKSMVKYTAVKVVYQVE